MRLQKTVNSPTQLRPSWHKQGRDGVNNKAGAQISTVLPTTATMTCHPPFSFSEPLPFTSFHSLLPLSSLFLLSGPPSSHPANLLLVALVTIQRGFSPQPRRQGNTWLSSRPLLEVRGPPVSTLARMLVGSVGICSAAAGWSGRT